MRAALSDYRIVLAAPQWQTLLLDPDGLVDEVYPAAGLEPLRWAGPRPALAVNLHGRGPQSHRLLGSLRPHASIAFGCVEADIPGPTWWPDEHERERWCRLVRTCLVVDADPDDVALVPPPVRPRVTDAVIVHPGAAYRSRQWAPECFGELVAALRADGHRIVVTGTERERPLAVQVASRAGLPDDAILAGRTRIDELAALVSAARLVVSGDTGVAHLAGAYRTPSVTLFGPTPPRLWGPPIAGPHTVIWHGPGDGDPWADTTDSALARVRVEEVLDAARGRLTSAF
ncbi:MAG: glycosyltransferase family 9 protein [Nocardioidaceae bacterium]